VKEIILETKDSEKIYANWYEKGNPGVILICHGLLEYKDSSTFRSISEEMAKDFDVLTIDMRGHGKSTGKYTYGAKEALDVQSGIDFLKIRYGKIVLLGFSLGASVSLEAAVRNKCVDGLILISPSAAFSKIRPKLWTVVAIKTGIGNIGSGKKVWGFNVFMKKPSNLDNIKNVKIPVLMLHGTKDWVINHRHSIELKDAAPKNVELIIIKDGTHAEYMYKQDAQKFVNRINDWLKKRRVWNQREHGVNDSR